MGGVGQTGIEPVSIPTYWAPRSVYFGSLQRFSEISHFHYATSPFRKTSLADPIALADNKLLPTISTIGFFAPLND